MTTSRVPLRNGEAIRLVARREIVERLRGKAFYALTGLLVVIILGIGIAARIAQGSGPDELRIGLVASDAQLFTAAADAIAERFDRTASVQSFDDVAAANAALEDGDIDVAVVEADGQVVFAEDVDQENLAIVQQAWATVDVSQSLLDAGLTPAHAQEALSTERLEPVTLEGDDGNPGLALLVGTMAAVLLFISLQTFGNYVLTGVVEEKSTAVVELLLVRVRADQLLAGKVIGIGVAALLQFVIAVVATLAALAISGVEVPGEIWSAVPMTAVWFLGGYVLYSTLFGLAGSLVSRQEDAQAASAPILAVLIGAYMIIFFVGFAPDSTATMVLSLLPPIAPFLMPMRMAAGAASVVEIALALVLLVATTFFVWKLASRIYEQVLLRRGSRIGWRDAAALARRSD